MAWAATTKRWMDWRLWLDAVGASEVASTDGLMFSDYNLAVQAAVAGQGMVLGSWPILRDMVAAGLLVQPFKDGVDTDIGYDLVTTPEARTRPEIVSFVDWALAAARQ